MPTGGRMDAQFSGTMLCHGRWGANWGVSVPSPVFGDGYFWWIEVVFLSIFEVFPFQTVCFPFLYGHFDAMEESLGNQVGPILGGSNLMLRCFLILRGWTPAYLCEDYHRIPIKQRVSRQYLGGGNSNIFYFHPENWGRWTHFDVHIFQMGWFNHQQDDVSWFWGISFEAISRIVLDWCRIVNFDIHTILISDRWCFFFLNLGINDSVHGCISKVPKKKHGGMTPCFFEPNMYR